MDIESLTHTGYKNSVIIAVALSAIVVTLASLLGRGALNLKSALVLEEPSDVTVIALVEPKLEEDIRIQDIDFLRKETHAESERPYYAYQVKTSDDQYAFVKIRFDTETQTWTLLTYESLHGDPLIPESPGV